jgi:hypothetical protein
MKNKEKIYTLEEIENLIKNNGFKEIIINKNDIRKIIRIVEVKTGCYQYLNILVNGIVKECNTPYQELETRLNLSEILINNKNIKELNKNETNRKIKRV